MKRKLISFFLTGILILSALPAFAAPDFKEILREVDRMSTFENTDFSATYTIVSEKPGEETDVTQAQIFRRDKTDKFLILILKPEVQKGQGYLRIDENVWFYDPESRKFNHSSMKDNFQDSDAKNDDFNNTSLAEDYEVTEWEEGKLGKFPVYVLQLSANNDEVTYPKLKLWITRDRNMVLKAEEYSLSDRLMRTSLYPGYTKVGDRLLPSKMLFVDELKKGERTQITLSDPSLSELPDYVFTKSYLERVNR